MKKKKWNIVQKLTNKQSYYEYIFWNCLWTDKCFGKFYAEARITAWKQFWWNSKKKLHQEVCTGSRLFFLVFPFGGQHLVLIATRSRLQQPLRLLCLSPQKCLKKIWIGFVKLWFRFSKGVTLRLHQTPIYNLTCPRHFRNRRVFYKLACSAYIFLKNPQFKTHLIALPRLSP